MQVHRRGDEDRVQVTRGHLLKVTEAPRNPLLDGNPIERDGVHLAEGGDECLGGGSQSVDVTGATFPTMPILSCRISRMVGPSLWAVGVKGGHAGARRCGRVDVPATDAAMLAPADEPSKPRVGAFS